MTYRSAFEAKVVAWMKSRGIRFEYEPERFSLLVPAGRTHICGECGHGRAVMRRAVYIPDFLIHVPGGQPFWLETKGRLDAPDRRKMEIFRASHDLRILFMRDNWLTKARVKRYSGWADSIGLPWAIGTAFPLDWMEPVT